MKKISIFFYLQCFALIGYGQQQRLTKIYNEYGQPIYPTIYHSVNGSRTQLNHLDSLAGIDTLEFKYGGRTTIRYIPPQGKDTIVLHLYDKSILEDGEPKQIITAEQLALSGKNTLEEALVYVLPSFFASWQIMADKSEFLTPTSLKGMGPDQFLVLINGKRRHASALLHVNGTFGRGTVSHDLVNIPIAAVQEIEIKSAAASVWHGTDAIAGIINIKLHDNHSPKAQSLIGLTGGYYLDNGLGRNHWWKESHLGNEREGKIYFNTLNTFGKSNQAFLNVSGEMLHLGHINRSSEYGGNIYKSGDSATLTLNDAFWKKTPYTGHKVLLTGRSQIQQTTAYFNSEVPVTIGASEKMFLYAFGGASYKKGDIVGFYRFPKDSAKINTQVPALETGYQPHLAPTIGDVFFTSGMRIKLNTGKLDIAHSTGSSTIHNYLFDSFNADLGVHSPRDFYAGGNYYRQSTTDIQLENLISITDSFLKAKTLNNIHIRAGAVRRSEAFRIVSGDEASYYYNNTVDATESGAQKLAGFDKSDEIERSRTNYGIFAQTKFTFHQPKYKLVEHVTVGGRYETFDKLRYATSYNAPQFKISGAVIYADPTKVIEGRISWNQGFRTPSLNQLYFSGISSQYRGATPYLVYIAKNESLLAHDFGVKPLKPETAISFNGGLTFRHPGSKWELKADYSRTKVEDRIILSGFFDVKNGGIASTLFKREPTLELRSVSSALFFINYPSSVTHNVDASWSYNGVKHNIQIGFNWNKTSIDKDPKTPLSQQLKPFESNFFGREERSRYEEVIPAGKLFIVVSGQFKESKSGDWALDYKSQVTWFGQNAYRHPVDTSTVFDQVFDNKMEPIIDLEFGYACKIKTKNHLKFTLGVQNVWGFKSNQIQSWGAILKQNALNANAKEREYNANVIVDGALPYSRRVQTYGVGGAFLYLKMSYQIGQKDRKNR